MTAVSADEESRVVYADTSGLFAALDSGDLHHPEAATIMRALVQEGSVLVTTNYVVTELTALVQSRLGLDVALRVHRGLLPALEIVFVERELHVRAVAAWTVARRRGLSLVDCSGFELMSDLGVVSALAFDRHFREQGFELPTVR
ncbi:MAG: PIN domain-containing protein [Actinobacteria bacterium]|nr:PIN domain-containing protein [Actinomycetota bacterium]